MDTGDDLARKGQALLATSVTSTVLAIGTCGVRFVAGRRARKRLWWDDYSVMAAMVHPLPPSPFPTTNIPR